MLLCAYGQATLSPEHEEWGKTVFLTRTEMFLEVFQSVSAAGTFSS